MKMTRAWQTFGFALVMLLVLGTGWVVEKTMRGVHSHGNAATGEPAKPNDAVRPAATDQELDRSDLILSQG
jgi:hypothetical protein